MESDHSKLRFSFNQIKNSSLYIFTFGEVWLSPVLSEPLLTNGKYAPVKGLRLLSRKYQRKRVAGAVVTANLIWSWKKI